MFDAWKQIILGTPPGRPIRWMFLLIGLLFVVQSLVFLQSFTIRSGILLGGIGNLLLFAAEMLHPHAQLLVGRIRLSGMVCSVAGAIVVLTGAWVVLH